VSDKRWVMSTEWTHSLIPVTARLLKERLPLTKKSARLIVGHCIVAGSRHPGETRASSGRRLIVVGGESVSNPIDRSALEATVRSLCDGHNERE